MPFKYCNHIKENGTYCRAAALRDRDYCYFHLRVRARRLAIAQARSEGNTWNLQLPPLEDMHAVQSSIMQVMEALAAGVVDQRRARLMLQALQMASTNLRSNAWLSPSRFELKPDTDFRALSCNTLEKEFALPGRIDIDTPPEVAFAAPAPEEEPARRSARMRKPQSIAGPPQAAATAPASKTRERKHKIAGAKPNGSDRRPLPATGSERERASIGRALTGREDDRVGQSSAAKRPPHRVTLEDLLYSHSMQNPKE